MIRLLALPLLLWVATARAQTFAGSGALDAAIEQAIQDDQIPGAVMLVQQNGKLLHLKAYGLRSVETKEKMTVDTIFDVASLTKVVAATPSIMKLFDEGKLRTNDRVTQYLPDFQDGKSDITVRHLLTHFSGMRPDLDPKPVWSGYETGVRLAEHDRPVALPGERFIYSDINFILLGEIVHKLSGKMLNEYAREQVYVPLGMKDTMYLPPAALRTRIAPTERLPGDARSLRGVVHDWSTRYMGGVSGHAGLFSTATDLARYAEMLLNGGELGGRHLFSPLTVKKFTTPESPATQPVLRGFGFDIDSPYSGNRGELFPIGSYGHTGFTGTSLWIDPVTRTTVILLANSVHPQLRPAITSLRGRVATVVAAALGIDTPGVSITGYNETIVGPGVHRAVNRNGQTLTGLDVLAADGFSRLKGRRVGLITNHTGLTRDGQRNIDAMRAAGVNLVALFSPEHGIAGKEDTTGIGNSKDSSGIPVYSLYSGENRRPNDEMLRGIDVLVFDIQDVGARFYTYSCTMAYALEESAKRKLPFIVLDRPNPITGVHVEGPMLDRELGSFVGCYSAPLRHGMTLGELARMIDGERQLGARLEVVQMKGWQRGDWLDSTGLAWVDPSPNMRSLNAALLYDGVAMIEYSKNYSVGRGTDAPFEQIGADWIKGEELAHYLNVRHVPGVRFYPTRFRPVASNFSGKLIEGVRFVITDRELFNSVRLGLEIGVALEKLYPGKIDWEANARLIGNRETLNAMKAGEDPRAIQAKQEEPLKNFVIRREPYLLYR